MIVPRSVPGTWFAVVTDGVAVLLPPSAAPALLDDVWTALRDGDGLDAVPALLEGTTTACGAVSVVGGAVRALLRGDVVLTVSTDEGQEVLRGEDGRWARHDLGAVTGLLLEAVGAERGAGGPLPVLAAVVPSAAVELALDVAQREVPGDDAPGDDALAGAGPVDDSIDDATILTRPHVAMPAVPASAEPDDDADTILRVTPELRARVDELAAQDAAASGGATVLAEGPDVGTAPGEAGWELDEDHLDAMTVLGVDAQLRARVDALAASAQAAPAAPALPPAPAPPAPPAPAPRGPAPVAASSVVDAAADHDGLTVMSSDLVEIRKNLPTWTGDRVPGPFAVPSAERGPAKLVMSSGLVVTLERTVLIGRAPVVSRVPNRSLPRLVTVPSPHHDISRTHVQVQDDGDRVFVTDLHSTNGVVVHTAGSAPVRLAPGTPTLLALGATVDIGDGVTFSVVRDR